jgi:hypothetical protein
MDTSMKSRRTVRNLRSNSMGGCAPIHSGLQRERPMITHVITFDHPLSQSEAEHFREVCKRLGSKREREILLVGSGGRMERLEPSRFPSVRVRNAQKTRVR